MAVSAGLRAVFRLIRMSVDRDGEEMKSTKDRVLDCIVEKSREFIALNEEIPKFETRFLSDQLNLQRSNVSSILNKLVEEGKLKKTNGRPVMFCL